MKGWPVLALALALTGCGEAADDPAPPVTNGITNVAIPTPTASAPIVNRTEPATSDAAPARPVEPSPAMKPSARARPPVEDRPPDFHAIGTEPFWSLTVRASVAMLERPGKPPRRFAVSRTDDAKAIHYRGEGFAMTATAGPCSDGMSDAIWSDLVQIAFADGTLKGCGGVRELREEPR